MVGGSVDVQVSENDVGESFVFVLFELVPVVEHDALLLRAGSDDPEWILA